MSVQQHQLPNGYTVESTDPLCLVNYDSGIVIDVTEITHLRKEGDRHVVDKYTHRVTVAVDQKEKYSGVFPTEDMAERKARNLAEQYD